MTAQTLDAFQVIADLSLRQMLKLLSKETLRKNALAENFDMTRAAVSKHIRILYGAGFISTSGIGRDRHYILKQKALTNCRTSSTTLTNSGQQSSKN